jgi:hypothetical protein
MADWGLPRPDGSYAQHGLSVPVNAGPDGARLPPETSANLSELCAQQLNANEQGEPSTAGTWYLLLLDDLRREGWNAIEVHYVDTGDDDGPPNALVLHRIEVPE